MAMLGHDLGMGFFPGCSAQLQGKNRVATPKPFGKLRP